MSSLISPGSKLGVLGGGQLGRMFALAAHRLGYEVHVYSPDAESPAGSICEKEFVAPYTDLASIEKFASEVDVVTLEFENIPLEAARCVESVGILRPGSRALEISQHRGREKRFVESCGVAATPFVVLTSLADIQRLPADYSFPAVLKTAELGYDGRGQRKVSSKEELASAFNELGQVECILEEFISFDFEISLIGARNPNGQVEFIGAMRNDHANHILDVSSVPAQITEVLQTKAEHAVRTILDGLDYVGVLCVEFFVNGEELLVNEIAPRPHNSGHISIEAHSVSQFEQQVRAVCNLPLAPVTLRSAAASANILGHCWDGGEPQFEKLLDCDAGYLHLYGKKSARPGRKMGHFTVLADSPELAREKVVKLRALIERFD